MNYVFNTYTLKSGHTIITPDGKPMSEEQFQEYFSFCCDWLKDVNPEAYEEIKPTPDAKSYGSMVHQMLIGLLHNKEGWPLRYYLDPRPLAFFFVVSYYIQKEDRERIDPFLARTLGHALLEWLPQPELVVHYLDISARNLHIDDAITLTKIYSLNTPSTRFPRQFAYLKDPAKAFEYAKLAYEFACDIKCPDLADCYYAEALYDLDKKNAEECMSIVLKRIAPLKGGEKELSLGRARYLALGYKIMDENDAFKGRISNEAAYDVVMEEGLHRTYYTDKLAYRVALDCRKEDADKAIAALKTIQSEEYRTKAAIALANIYLEKKDPDQAACIAIMGTFQKATPGMAEDVELGEIVEKANKELGEARYNATLVEEEE